LGEEADEEITVAVERTAEVMVGRSTPREWMEVAVAIAAERREVGVASWRREASEGSKPGGGSIEILCPAIWP
jgi:hypothetical protein